MQIKKTERFLSELESILDFIARDSFQQALNFKNGLDGSVYLISEMPYKYRQSSKSKDSNIRDMIFNGYVIPYRINMIKNQIELLGIFSSNIWNS
jgi:toxin ParE1/3/4